MPRNRNSIAKVQHLQDLAAWPVKKQASFYQTIHQGILFFLFFPGILKLTAFKWSNFPSVSTTVQKLVLVSTWEFLASTVATWERSTIYSLHEFICIVSADSGSLAQHTSCGHLCPISLMYVHCSNFMSDFTVRDVPFMGFAGFRTSVAHQSCSWQRPPLTLRGWQTKSFPGGFVHVFQINWKIIMCFSSLHLHKMNYEEATASLITCLHRQLWWVQGWKQNKHAKGGKSIGFQPFQPLKIESQKPAPLLQTIHCWLSWLSWLKVLFISLVMGENGNQLRRHGWIFFNGRHSQQKNMLPMSWKKYSDVKGMTTAWIVAFVSCCYKGMQTYHVWCLWWGVSMTLPPDSLV